MPEPKSNHSITRESVLRAIKSRESILKAIREFDEMGRSQFLSKYGFGRSRAYYLSYKGKLYDSKAIMGVAYGYEHPKLGPLAGRDFHGGEHTVQKYLEQLGFRLVIDSAHSEAQPNRKAIKLHREEAGL